MSGKHLNDISKVYLDTIANVKKAETDADIKRWEDLGGPTPGNYRADDNSAKLKEGRRLRKSDWRQDLKEVIDKPETEEKAEKKVSEKKVKNKVVINPSFKEAIEEIGGELLEVNEVDSVEKTQDDTQKRQEAHKKQLESKQKKIAAMKKLVLQKKMQAVRGGAGSDITAGYEPEGEVVVEKDLNAAERRALPNKDFVFPGKGEGPEGKQRGAYPINDKKHARAALAMAAAHASPEKEAKVKAAVKKKYPEIEVQSEAVGSAVTQGVKAAGKWAVRQGIKVGGKAGGKFVKKAGKEAVKAAGEVAVEAGKGAVDAAKKRGRKAGEDFATNVGKKKEVDESVAAPAKKQEGKGEKIGKTVGSIAGGVAGSAAVAGPTLGVGSIAAGIAGSTAGEKVGGEIGKKFDKKKPVKEGVLQMVKSLGKKKTIRKPKMDSTTDKIHKWRKEKEKAERRKYVSDFDPIDEAKVDTGTPEEKEKARNIRKFGVSHNVAGHGKLRRALHRSDRGYKKKKGDKSQYVEMEGTDKAFNFVVNKLKAQHGDGVLTKGDKMPEPSAAQKKKNAEIRAKRAKEDGRDATEKASDGRYNDRSRSD